jgi:hypothetical protein
MADHPNVATFRSIYAAFTGGDMATLATFFVAWEVWKDQPAVDDFWS